jgi:hypothetical protein
LPHSHVAHKGLEVVAFGRQLSRLAEIPVEDSDTKNLSRKIGVCALAGENYQQNCQQKSDGLIRAI